MTHIRILMTGMTGPLIASIFVGCGGVFTAKPLTQTTATELRKPLTGTWVTGDNALQIRFDSNGVGHIGGVQWDKKKERFTLTEGELRAVKTADQRFLSVRFRNEDGSWPGEHSLLAYNVLDSGDWIIWSADENAFAKVVENETLAGKVQKDEKITRVTLTGKPVAILKAISDDDAAGLFNYRKPVVLRKLPREKK
ncbi:MAG: hypothetical protein ACLFVY_12975 [Phycisphaerae bacterium]